MPTYMNRLGSISTTAYDLLSGTTLEMKLLTTDDRSAARKARPRFARRFGVLRRTYETASERLCIMHFGTNVTPRDAATKLIVEEICGAR
jgi:hypothetical protein